VRTVNEQDGRMTPGDVSADFQTWQKYKGRCASLSTRATWILIENDRDQHSDQHPGCSHAEAVEWVRNCPLYIARTSTPDRDETLRKALAVHVGEHADLADAVAAACAVIDACRARVDFFERTRHPLHTADLSTWCQRYEGEAIRYVKGRCQEQAADAIVEVGFDPNKTDPGCRQALLGKMSWHIYRADGAWVASGLTEAQAIRWVEDGVLP
jgi:hypothetical protein